MQTNSQSSFKELLLVDENAMNVDKTFSSYANKTKHLTKQRLWEGQSFLIKIVEICLKYSHDVL